jgi:uncharacterized protein YndB with AHSA1/START domain
VADLPTYVLERVFDAPSELVWKTWTDPKLVPRWYGPGAESIVHRHESEPGGLWLHESCGAAIKLLAELLAGLQV